MARTMFQSEQEADNADVEAKLQAQAKHAQIVGRAARLLTDQAGALVDANRLEMLDIDTAKATGIAEAVLRRVPATLICLE